MAQIRVMKRCDMNGHDGNPWLPSRRMVLDYIGICFLNNASEAVNELHDLYERTAGDLRPAFESDHERRGRFAHWRDIMNRAVLVLLHDLGDERTPREGTRPTSEAPSKHETESALGSCCAAFERAPGGTPVVARQQPTMEHERVEDALLDLLAKKARQKLGMEPWHGPLRSTARTHVRVYMLKGRTTLHLPLGSRFMHLVRSEMCPDSPRGLQAAFMVVSGLSAEEERVFYTSAPNEELPHVPMELLGCSFDEYGGVAYYIFEEKCA